MRYKCSELEDINKIHSYFTFIPVRAMKRRKISLVPSKIRKIRESLNTRSKPVSLIYKKQIIYFHLFVSNKALIILG